MCSSEESNVEQGERVPPDLGTGYEPEYFLAQRRVDTLRIYTEWRWARLNQIAAIVLSAIQIYFFQNFAVVEMGAKDQWFVAILGGLVAPFAKDLVTRLRS